MNKHCRIIIATMLILGITGVSLYTTADEIQWSWFGNIDKNQFVPTCKTCKLPFLKQLDQHIITRIDHRCRSSDHALINHLPIHEMSEPG